MKVITSFVFAWHGERFWKDTVEANRTWGRMCHARVSEGELMPCERVREEEQGSWGGREGRKRMHTTLHRLICQTAFPVTRFTCNYWQRLTFTICMWAHTLWLWLISSALATKPVSSGVQSELFPVSPVFPCCFWKELTYKRVINHWKFLLKLFFKKG